MGNDPLLAITAIKDMDQEGFIASALTRSGWKVVYRATSPELLNENLERTPSAVLVLSDDFIAFEKVQFENIILIKGCSHAIGREGVTAPSNEFELGELMRNRAESNSPREVAIPATQSRVIALLGAAGGVGTSTLAINISDQLASSNAKALLVDASFAGLSFADHFEVHDIRSKARELNESLALFEISDISGLAHLSTIASQFDYIILDLGHFHSQSFSGVRIRDRILQWALHSQGLFILASGGGKKGVENGLRKFNLLRESLPVGRLELAITLDSIMSRRDRAQFEIEISGRISSKIATFSRDAKAIELSRERASTLQNSSPRSLLNREITDFVSERLA